MSRRVLPAPGTAFAFLRGLAPAGAHAQPVLGHGHLEPIRLEPTELLRVCGLLIEIAVLRSHTEGPGRDFDHRAEQGIELGPLRLHTLLERLALFLVAQLPCFRLRGLDHLLRRLPRSPRRVAHRAHHDSPHDDDPRNGPGPIPAGRGSLRRQASRSLLVLGKRRHIKRVVRRRALRRGHGGLRLHGSDRGFRGGRRRNAEIGQRLHRLDGRGRIAHHGCGSRKGIRQGGHHEACRAPEGVA